MPIKGIYSIKCKKNGKFKNLKVLYIVDKTLVLFNIFDKCCGKNEKIFKEGSFNVGTIINLTKIMEEYQMHI